MSEFEDRRSTADPVELIADPAKKAHREAENGIRQFKAALDIVRRHLDGQDGDFRLTHAVILELHHKALQGIHLMAGTYRNAPVTIGKSRHVPPRHWDVADHVGAMCECVNSQWHGRDAIELAAYVLWRMHWIHPFADGNGRTARVVSYVVLSAKLDSLLPGTPTIPEQIASDKAPHYKALEEADDSWKRGIVALSGMEAMPDRMLNRQLENASAEGGRDG